MQGIDSVVSWLVSLMISWTPNQLANMNDNITEKYKVIAEDAALVAYDPGERSMFPSQQKGRAMTAVVMLKTAMEESGYFDEAVMLGTKRGDHGRSWCMMQINIGKGKTREGWTGPELIADNQKCFRAGLHILQGSFGYCSHLSFHSRLSGYTTGRCIEGEQHSIRRMSSFARINFKRAPTDQEVFESPRLYDMLAYDYD